MTVTFWLGIHQPSWLAETDCPMLLNRTRLAGRASFPRARGPWALDSGAFSELAAHGRWRIDTGAWAEEIVRYAAHIGRPALVAPLDWLCAPPVLAATGRSVDWHLDATVAAYTDLVGALPPDLAATVVPTVQGWTPAQYADCTDRYERAGVDLSDGRLVGVGTLAGHQRDVVTIATVCGLLGERGVGRLHAFGVHSSKLQLVAHRAVSADSATWSQKGKRHPRRADCPHGGTAENNCLRFALEWRHRMLDELAQAHAAAEAALQAVTSGDVWAAVWDDAELEVALAAVDAAVAARPRPAWHRWDRTVPLRLFEPA